MNKNSIVLTTFLCVSFFLRPDTSCIGITSVNPVTFVTEQHPLRYVNCPCNCAQSSHLEDSTCITCSHKHGDSNVLQTAYTTGTFITFMSPEQATIATPTDADFVDLLERHLQTKHLQEDVPFSEKQ